jgi:cytochrome c-type biogenesis protein CcmH/NrfF
MMIGGEGMTFGQLVVWAIPQVMLIVGVWFAVRGYQRRS